MTKSLILGIISQLQRLSGKQYLPPGQKLPKHNLELATQISNELFANKGKSLVLGGYSDSSTQILISAINYLLGNYGKTIILNKNEYYQSSSDREFEKVVGEMNAGEISAMLIW